MAKTYLKIEHTRTSYTKVTYMLDVMLKDGLCRVARLMRSA